MGKPRFSHTVSTKSRKDFVPYSVQITLPFPVSSFRFRAVYHLFHTVQGIKDLFPAGRANDMPTFHIYLVLEISAVCILDSPNGVFEASFVLKVNYTIIIGEHFPHQDVS
jgi:hypothetical protein